MSHDLIAELAGYRSELDNYRNRPDRAAQVQTQIDRVTAAIANRIGQLLAQADNHMTAGNDVLAAQAMTEARRLATESGIDLSEPDAGLDDLDEPGTAEEEPVATTTEPPAETTAESAPAEDTAAPAEETAAATAPLETATPRRKPKGA